MLLPKLVLYFFVILKLSLKNRKKNFKKYFKKMFKKIFKKSLKQISNKKIISDFAMRFQQKWFQRKSGGLIIL